jgi:hypothetical protein
MARMTASLWEALQMAQMRGTRLTVSSGVLPTVSRSMSRGPSRTWNLDGQNHVAVPLDAGQMSGFDGFHFWTSLSFAANSSIFEPLKVAILLMMNSALNPFCLSRV